MAIDLVLEGEAVLAPKAEPACACVRGRAHVGACVRSRAHVGAASHAPPHCNRWHDLRLVQAGAQEGLARRRRHRNHAITTHRQNK
jgi:hypothetical protein